MSAPADAVDARLMERALTEAAKGRTSPNPRVGAVVAHGETIVAVGHHARAGADHAEVAALKLAGEAARGATLYCTLEPCNHHGRTPPCTDALIAAGVARVVIAARDPWPHVPGAIEKLTAAGISVALGVREAEGRVLIADFAHHISTGLPYAILKAAVTLDGRTAARTGDSRWITGEEARTEAHRMRDRADAVLVGVGTVLADDPSLDVRHVAGVDPARVILDTHLRTPHTAKIIAHTSSAPSWIFHGREARGRAAALAREGVETIDAPTRDGHLDLREVFLELGRRDVVRLLVEGGATVHGTLLREGLACHAAIFVAPLLLGDPEARPLAAAGPRATIAEALRLREPTHRILGADVLVEGGLL